MSQDLNFHRTIGRRYVTIFNFPPASPSFDGIERCLAFQKEIQAVFQIVYHILVRTAVSLAQGLKIKKQP
jgi:hypothetical protein